LPDLVRFMDGANREAGMDLTYVMEPKLDGLACRLFYRDGKLVEATTRGDGSEGENIINNVQMVSNIPYLLQGRRKPYELEVRGELVADLELFGQLNERLIASGQKPYANARNFVAGNMRQLKPENVFGEVIRFYAYEVATGGELAEDHSLAMTSIRSFGFDCVVGRQVKTHKQLEEAVEHFRKLREKKGSVFFCDIDGAVLKVSSYGIRQLLGDTSHHPRWAVAFKYPPMSGLSTLEDIEITVGRTGVLTPVGKVTPVKIGGVQITSVNLANFDKIETLGVSIGDTVELSS